MPMTRLRIFSDSEGQELGGQEAEHEGGTAEQDHGSLNHAEAETSVSLMNIGFASPGDMPLRSASLEVLAQRPASV